MNENKILVSRTLSCTHPGALFCSVAPALCCSCPAGRAYRQVGQERWPARGKRNPRAVRSGPPRKGKAHRAGGVRRRGSRRGATRSHAEERRVRKRAAGGQRPEGQTRSPQTSLKEKSMKAAGGRGIRTDPSKTQSGASRRNRD